MFLSKNGNGNKISHGKELINQWINYFLTSLWVVVCGLLLFKGVRE
jgi:hypothetical protein